MGVHLRRNRIRLHLSGPWGHVDLRWTERTIGSGWRAEEHQANGTWRSIPAWDAVSKDHLSSHLRYINAVDRNAA